MKTNGTTFNELPVAPEGTDWTKGFDVALDTSKWGDEWFIGGEPDKKRFEALTGERILSITKGGQGWARVSLGGFALKGTEDPVSLAMARKKSSEHLAQKVNECIGELSVRNDADAVVGNILKKRRGRVLVGKQVYEHFQSKAHPGSVSTGLGFMDGEETTAGRHITFFKDPELESCGIYKVEVLPNAHAKALLLGKTHERNGYQYIEVERIHNVPVLITFEDRKFAAPSLFIIDPRDQQVHRIPREGYGTVMESATTLEEAGEHIEWLMKKLHEESNEKSKSNSIAP